MRYNSKNYSTLLAIAGLPPIPQYLKDKFPHSGMPAGYKNPDNLSAYPEAVAIARRLMRSYRGEEGIIYTAPNETEFLIKMDLHFDNHPTGPDTPDFWHPGASVYEKKKSDQSFDSIEDKIKIVDYTGKAKKPEEIKKEKEEKSFLEKLIDELSEKLSYAPKKETIKNKKTKQEIKQDLKKEIKEEKDKGSSISLVDELKKKYEEALSGVKSFFA